MEFFFFQNNPKNLDPSYKMDLDLWDLIRKGKTRIIAKFHRTDLVICSHSREFYYQMEIFFFFKKKISKNLDPSYKMDLDLWDLFRKGKTRILAKFHRTELAICSDSREGKPHLIA